MPDHLLQRAKTAATKQHTTLRMLLVDALERRLNEPAASTFKLRDASTGTPSGAVSSDTINRAIDQQRERPFNL